MGLTFYFAVGVLCGLFGWYGSRLLDRIHGWPSDVEAKIVPLVTDGQMAWDLSQSQWKNRHGMWYAPHSDDPMSLDVAYAEWQRWNVCTTVWSWQPGKRNGVPK